MANNQAFQYTLAYRRWLNSEEGLKPDHRKYALTPDEAMKIAIKTWLRMKASKA